MRGVPGLENFQVSSDEPVPLEAAVVEAGAVRMRPIRRTTVTSIMGSLPLALGLGAGGELMRPLAIAVGGGLDCSTLLTLFVVPCAYILVQRSTHAPVRSALPSAGRIAAAAGPPWRTARSSRRY